MKRLCDDASFVFVLVAVGVAILYIVAPIIVALAMSFDSRAYLGPFPPTDVSLQYYVRFFTTEEFMRGLGNSLMLATLATVITGITGAMAAIVISEYEFPGKTALSALFLSPLMIPAVVVGFGILMFITSFLGIYNGFTRLLAAHVIITMPYMIRTTIAGLTGIKPSLREVALSLGANERQAFWDVTFPLAKTGIVAGCIFVFATSLDDVAVGLFLYDADSMTLPVVLITYMRANFDLSVAAAAVFLAGITVMLVFVLDRTVGLDKVMGQGVYRA
jgi:putative spermidine/putrescine transport system permease protein